MEMVKDLKYASDGNLDHNLGHAQHCDWLKPVMRL